MRGKVLLRVVAMVALALALGMLSVGCGGSEGESGSSQPPSLQEASSVIVRVSGTEGITYSGDYGPLTEDPRPVDDTLGNEPQEYEVREGISSGVTAFFEKVEPGGGELKAEILADGVLVTDSRTYAEFGTVVLEWLPPGVVPTEEGALP